ncbi:MAG: carboxypeptidase regulatory-like domain-containing protein, partial [Bacteroidetes bacterium]|nr:carboxypeptidase regulatory-like domain-containing protein [Bacteroidota bacterium]
FNSICASLLFEVDNFLDVSSARLTVIQQPSSRIVFGAITPALKDMLVGFYSYSPNVSYLRYLIPDSSGTVSLQFDTTANPEVTAILTTLDVTPDGFIPPSDTLLKIVNDTTYFSLSYQKAKEFIEGFVKDQNGDPVRKARLVASTRCPFGCDNDRTIFGISDSSGYFKLGAIAGYWTLELNPPAHSDEYLQPTQSYEPFSIDQNQTVQHNMLLQRSNSTIIGSVKINSSGVGGIPVVGSSNILGTTTYTQPNGTYTLKVFKPLSEPEPYFVSINMYEYGYYFEPSGWDNVLPGTTNVNFSIVKVSGGLQGRIIDEKTGQGIPNADMSFSGPAYRYTTSDDSGYYKIHLRSGMYSLSVYADYYQSIFEFTVNITDAVSVKNISMKRTGSISGMVTDEQGKPMPNISVTVQDSLNNFWTVDYTNSAGKFVIDGIQTGQYFAVARSNGYVQQWYNNTLSMDSADAIPVTFGYDTPNINFVLSRGGSFSGSVKDKNGTPVSNAEVFAIDSTSYLYSLAFTNDSGNYIVNGLSTNNYYAIVSSDNFLEQWYNGASDIITATTIPVIINTNTPHINFIVQTGGVITGSVTTPLGNPIAGVTVSVLDSNYYYVESAHTDPSGNYAVKKLPVGKKLYVTASKDQYSQRWYNNVETYALATPLIFQDDEWKENINFTLPKAASITGMVKNTSGVGISYASIYAVNSTGSYFSVSANNAGAYTLNNIPGGKYIVSASSYEYLEQWYNQQSSRLNADTISVLNEQTVLDIDFSLAKGGKISGSVQNSNGDPIPNAWIYISSRSGYYSVMTADGQGYYNFPGIAPGQYSVSAEYPGYSKQWYDHQPSMYLADSVSISAEQFVTGINFHLEKINTDSVKVKLVMNNLPNAVKFSQTHVGDYITDYWWGIRFELFNNAISGPEDFETELALAHVKLPGDVPFNADPVSASQHMLIQWHNDTGQILKTNVRVWKNLLEKNTLYFAAPKAWDQLKEIGAMVKFYARTMYYSPEGQLVDTTITGTGTSTVFDAAGDISYGGTDIVSAGWNIVTPVEELTETIPQTFSLKQNYPNPFNPSTTIWFALPYSTHVRITIHDLLGRTIATLVDGQQTAGWKEVKWNAQALSSGMYFFRLQAGGYSNFKKMLLLK